LGCASDGSFTLYDATAVATRLTIASTGAATFSNNILAGNTASSGSNIITITNTSGSIGANAIFRSSVGGIAAELRTIYGANAGYVGTTTASDFNIITNNTNKITILSNGNVGIGEANPSSKFQITGGNMLIDNSSTGTAPIRLKGTGTTTGFDIQNDNNDAYLWNRDSGNIYFATAGVLRMTIASNGSIGAPSGTNIYNASDIRLKRNITVITNGLDKINALNPVKFNWIDGFEPTENEKVLLGFIAQEVQSVIPESVEDFGNNSITIGETIVENPLRVNEKFIIPVLVKAIQELSIEIEQLKALIAAK
jgi:hypothetical protein